jgi:hypothetical protein
MKSHLVHKGRHNKIRGYNDAGWHPLEKVALVITRVENQLVTDELLPGGGPDQEGDAGALLFAAAYLQGNREQLQVVLNQKTTRSSITYQLQSSISLPGVMKR